LYLYFENKMELYLAICQRGSDKLNVRFSKILTRDHTGLEMIRMMGEAYLDFVIREPLYFQAFQFYEGVQDPSLLSKSDYAKKCEQNSREALTIMARALQIGMQDGSIDDAYDPKELAIMIWASSRGIVQLAYLKKQEHHFKMLDDIDLNMESLFASFIELLGTGMAVKEKNK
ncbi:MAG: TetR/AcrR family transcriptional regulator, partial [Balneolaceae bacterium]